MMNGLPVAGLDPAFKCNELKHYFTLIKPKIVFCEYPMFEEYKNAIEELNLNTTIVTFGDGDNSMAKFMEKHKVSQPENEFKVAVFNTDEVYCWLVSTSGSTGRSKIVALSHPHVLQMKEFYSYDKPKNGERKTALNLSNLLWISGCYNALTMPINHIKVQSSAPLTIESILDMINKYKPGATLCTPTAIAPLLHHKKHRDFTSFDVIKTGGSKVHKELLTSLKARVRPDTVIQQGYGLSESGGVVLEQHPEDPIASVGTLDPKYEAKLVSPETGKEILEPNATGELFIRGPTMACYYNDPEETKNVFTEDGYLKTGDLFYKDENGYYYFVDRLKMLLKYKSYQVVPPEVEEVILKHPGVADVCVTGIPHPNDGERVVACVVRRPGHHVTAEDIKEIVAKNLSPFKHLHGGVVFLDALPTTTTGKVARLEVKKLVLTAHRE
ncbi:4-coumarate--CoA ligase 1-like isoform X2 [Leguminivora glycinivorella]|nr:4-coumarate--CoA ligase 1-like isoform X2 [Leguminivora glycinivorella]